MKKYIVKYINEYKYEIAIICIISILGIISGAIIFNLFDKTTQNEIISKSKEVLNLSKESNFLIINIFKKVIFKFIFIFFSLYLFAYTFFCNNGIKIYNYILGILTGVFIPNLIKIYDGKNVFLVLVLYVVIPYIFYQISITYFYINSMFKNGKILENGKEKSGYFFIDIIKIVFCFFVYFIGAVIEELGIIYMLSIL